MSRLANIVSQWTKKSGKAENSDENLESRIETIEKPRNPVAVFCAGQIRKLDLSPAVVCAGWKVKRKNESKSCLGGGDFVRSPGRRKVWIRGWRRRRSCSKVNTLLPWGPQTVNLA